MDAMEKKIHRLNTKAFIDARSTVITLTPVEKQRTAGAQYDWVDLPPREPQTFRIIEFGRSTDATVTTADGQVRRVAYELLGEWNSKMEPGDHWVAEDGREWTIGDMMRDNDYEQRGLVTEYGK